MSDNTVLSIAFLVFLGICIVVFAAYSIFTVWLAYKIEQNK